jgi:hypothetical protein
MRSSARWQRLEACPSQVGVAITRMSLAAMRSRTPGQSSPGPASDHTLTTRESRVRCVRGGDPVTSSAGEGGAPPGRYAVRADGTVDDRRTQLTWQRVADPVDRTQADAIAHCAQLALAGAGWRLPTISELLTLVDPTRTGPSIDALAFPGTPPEVFWTATGHATVPAEAWNIYFLYGYSGSTDRAMTARARCVR